MKTTITSFALLFCCILGGFIGAYTNFLSTPAIANQVEIPSVPTVPFIISNKPGNISFTVDMQNGEIEVTGKMDVNQIDVNVVNKEPIVVSNPDKLFFVRTDTFYCEPQYPMLPLKTITAKQPYFEVDPPLVLE